MTRLERMTREAVQWMPVWGADWARDYLLAALIADERDRRRTRRQGEDKHG